MKRDADEESAGVISKDDTDDYFSEVEKEKVIKKGNHESTF